MKSLEPRIIVAWTITGLSMFTVMGRWLYILPRRRRERLRRRGVKTHEHARIKASMENQKPLL